MTQKRPDRTLGGNNDVFWDYCSRDELRIQRCDNCGHQAWPARNRCEVCRESRFSWEHLSGRGKLVSWSTFERGYYGDKMPVPYDTILVELEDGPLFISNPEGFSIAEFALDLPVEVTFLDAEDSAGAFRLPVFVRGEG